MEIELIPLALNELLCRYTSIAFIETMSEPPKVFISYSHDSPAHKRWVAELATRLRRAGIDATLDQWDLDLGADVTQFMEEGLGSSNRVLVICTDEYVRKANEGRGGVGYERLIVTAELVRNQGTNKFIPVIRQVSGEEKTPKFLATRLYIDFSNNDEYESKLEELIRVIHRTRASSKPPLGRNPFTDKPFDEAISEQRSGIELAHEPDSVARKVGIPLGSDSPQTPSLPAPLIAKPLTPAEALERKREKVILGIIWGLIALVFVIYLLAAITPK